MTSEKSTKDIMETMMGVMKESLDDMNSDKTYWQNKMEMYKKIGEEMSDYIKELNEASMILGTPEEAEDLTKITTKQIEIINKFEKKFPKMKKTMKSIKFTDPKKSKKISKDIASIKKQISNKKIEIKISNPTNPTIKLKPIQKLKYLQRKNK